jgi:hypothetical protein
MKPRTKPRKPAARPSARSHVPAKTRVYLTYPPDLLHEPLIYRVGHEFKIITNIRSVSISDDAGLAALELEGTPDEINRALSWFRSRGVKVERIDKHMVE